MNALTKKILFFSCFLTSSFVHPYPSLIESAKVFKNKISIIPCEAFRHTFLEDSTVTFEYDSDVDLGSLDFSVITIPFITMAAPAIWITGKVFTVETMDKDLYYSLKRIKAVFKLFYPTISWEGDIIPLKLAENMRQDCNDEIAVLFSGGLDSTSTSFGHIGKKQLLVTNQGVDVPFDNGKMWESVKAQCEAFAQTYQHKNTFIKCNYRSLFKESAVHKYMANTSWSWFEHVAHSFYLISPAAPLLFAKGYNNLYIAASATSDYPYQWGSHPLIDNCIKFCGMSVHHDQKDFTRPNKLKCISSITRKFGLPKPHLRVCWLEKKGNNCLECEKCLRTINAILSIGEQPKEYGFNTTIDIIKERTQSILSNYHLRDDLLLEWHHVQNACNKSLMNKAFNETCNQELISYLQWFSSLNLTEYKGKSYSKEHEKPFFSALWQLGCNLNTDQRSLPEESQ